MSVEHEQMGEDEGNKMQAYLDRCSPAVDVRVVDGVLYTAFRGASISRPTDGSRMDILNGIVEAMVAMIDGIGAGVAILDRMRQKGAGKAVSSDEEPQ